MGKMFLLVLSCVAVGALGYTQEYSGGAPAKAYVEHVPQGQSQDSGKQDSFSVGPQSYGGREAYGRGVTQPQARARPVYGGPQQAYAPKQQTYAPKQQGYGPQPIYKDAVGYAGKESVDRGSRSDYLLSAEERPDRAERMELQAKQEAREAADTLDRSPKPFNYGFEIEDEQGNTNFRKEDSDGGQGGVRGVYGYKDPYGIYRVVEYIANTDGFRAVVKTNEPGTGDQDPADAAVFAQPQGPPGYRKLSGPVVPGEYLSKY